MKGKDRIIFVSDHPQLVSKSTAQLPDRLLHVLTRFYINLHQNLISCIA